MNGNIPLKSRFLAIIGYVNSAVAAGSSVMAMFLLQKSSLFFSPQSIVERETTISTLKIATVEITNEYALHDFLTILRIVIVISYIVSLLSYILNTNTYSFTYLSAKTSSNCCRNIMIVMLIHMVINILGIVSILLYQPPKFSELLISNTVILGNVICGCLAIAYFLNAIIAGFYAARGQYLKSFLIYPAIEVR
jgi:hypothetical protein